MQQNPRDLRQSEPKPIRKAAEADLDLPTSSIERPGLMGPALTIGDRWNVTGTADDPTSELSSVQISVQREGGLCLNNTKDQFDQVCPHWLEIEVARQWNFELEERILEDGATYLLQSRAIDVAKNAQIEFGSADLHWDASAPPAEFSLNANAPVAIQNTVSVSLLQESEVHEWRLAEGTDCSQVSWNLKEVDTLDLSLSTGDGSKSLCLQVRDGVKNESEVQIATIILDTTAPSSIPQFPDTLGPDSTMGELTEIGGTAQDNLSSVNSVQVSVQAHDTNLCLNSAKDAFNQICPNWLLALNTTNWTLALADNLFVNGVSYTLLSQAWDGAGLSQVSFGEASFLWDSTTPDGSFALNAGATYTESPDVTISVADSASVFEFRKANAADCSNATWEAYQIGSIPHTLESGDGLKTVCLQVRDRAHNSSSVEIDVIILDQTAPQSVPLLKSNLGPNSHSGAATLLGGTAADSLSGVTSVYVSIRRDSDEEQCLNEDADAFDATCPIWHLASGTTTWSFTLADALFTADSLYEVNSRAQDAADVEQISLGMDSFTWISQWWLAGGINPANVVAAYLPIGASSQADSYINLANPGANDLTVGNLPGWAESFGWNFNGTSQYLKTGIIPAVGWSMIVRFSNGALPPGGSLRGAVGMRNTSGNRRFYIAPMDVVTLDRVIVAAGQGVTPGPRMYEGIIGLAGQQPYRNGLADGGAMGAWSTPESAYELYVGTLNINGAPGFYYSGYVQALAIYSSSLSPAQMTAVTEAMNYFDNTLPSSIPTVAAAIGPLSTAGTNTQISGTAADLTNIVSKVEISIKKDGNANACLNSEQTAFDSVCPRWHLTSGTKSWSGTFADILFLQDANYEVSSRATDNGGNLQENLGVANFTWNDGM